MSNNYRMKVSEVVLIRRKRRVYELAKAVTVENDIVSIVVPAGFKTDFASIPRILWWLLPPDGDYAIPALVHDYLLEVGYSRFFADAIFRQLMRDMDVAAWKRLIIYMGVRFWSLMAWIKGRFWGVFRCFWVLSWPYKKRLRKKHKDR